jgi:hypothetical protein
MILEDTLTQVHQEEPSERTLATELAEHIDALANRRDGLAEAV